MYEMDMELDLEMDVADESEDTPKRGRAFRRKMDYSKAKRKQRIDHETHPWHNGYYNNLHQYSKGKIHCSCGMCSSKTNMKHNACHWGPSYNPSMSDIHKNARMDDSYREDFLYQEAV